MFFFMGSRRVTIVIAMNEDTPRKDDRRHNTAFRIDRQRDERDSPERLWISVWNVSHLRLERGIGVETTRSGSLSARCASIKNCESPALTIFRPKWLRGS